MKNCIFEGFGWVGIIVTHVDWQKGLDAAIPHKKE